jgi:hypothetical protein
MATITDLERCDYFPSEGASLIAIGWLGATSEFNRGPVDGEFFLKLRELARAPWEPVMSFGVHACELCQFDAPAFASNVFVPYDGRIYVAPVGVIHYIAAHWYQPPSVFVDAVKACPDMRGMDYFRAIVACGGKGLLGNRSEMPA